MELRKRGRRRGKGEEVRGEKMEKKEFERARFKLVFKWQDDEIKRGMMA